MFSAAETQLLPDPDLLNNAIVSPQLLAPWNGP
jgi:hypothetical protein